MLAAQKKITKWQNKMAREKKAVIGKLADQKKKTEQTLQKATKAKEKSAAANKKLKRTEKLLAAAQNKARECLSFLKINVHVLTPWNCR